MEQESKNQPKANWDSLAAKAFCEICAQEKLDGNRPTAFLSNTGYKNLERKFYEITKRAYTRKQFKNRWDAMKSLYLAWKYYRSRATGLGWDPEKMTFTADEEWWKETLEGLFLWMVGGPQPVSQAQNRFKRSKETIHRKFEEVLECLVRLATDIIKPRDPEFSTLHSRLEDTRFYPHFNDCIGAIDGTHIRVVVPSDEIVNHVGRYGYPTQNVMAVCDFDMRFTSVVAGWPGSAHDTRIFKDTLKKYEEEFPHPPPGKYYLVDSGYPNQTGYLAPYKGQKYHLPEFRKGRKPSGKHEVFNHAHSSLRNVIERAFGVLNMKWRILLHITSYPMEKQARIIVACMALHNWIRESNLHDKEFYKCDQNENYMPGNIQPEPSVALPGLQVGVEHGNMNVTRENIADGLIGDV